jgi:hypothetical protein
MPGFNGSGTFVRSHDWTTDLSNTVPVTASRMDTEHDGFATGLSTCITKDNQTTTTARIDFAVGIGVTTGGVEFPASQSAVADANTLDDYEEGTFTPALTFGGAAVGLTYLGQLGKYTKVGNLVTFWVQIGINAIGSSTGTALVTALPFTSDAYSIGFPVHLSISTGVAITDLAGFDAMVDDSATTVALRYIDEAVGVTVMEDTDFATLSAIRVAGSYTST